MKGLRYKTSALLLGIILLGGAIRFLFLFTPWLDSDMAVNGLMARHILAGEFPLFFYGQHYCGSIQAFLVSILFLLFGASRFSLNLTILIESLVFIFLVYHLARMVIDQKGALLAGFLTAVPSYFLVNHSVTARSAYIEIPILGTLLFILTLRLLSRERYKALSYLLLGLLIGLSIWTHLLIVFYLIPLSFALLFKHREIWKPKSFGLIGMGVVVGGLPLWEYNVLHPLATWYFLRGGSGGEPYWFTLKVLALLKFPEILGVIDNETRRYFVSYFSLIVYLIYLLALGFLLILRGKRILKFFYPRDRDIQGIDFLLVFFLLFPFIFILSGFGGGGFSRYLMPLFTALPILTAFIYYESKKFFKGPAFRGMAVGCLFFILVSNGYGIQDRLFLLQPQRLKAYQETRKNDRDLFVFLKSRGLTRVYAHNYWIAPLLTFDAGEEILFAGPAGDRYPVFTQQVDAADQAAFLFQGEAFNVENSLRALGGDLRIERLGRYTLFYGFTPPPYQFIEIDPKQWLVNSNCNAGETSFVLDREMTTSWSSRQPQRPGIFLEVDLGKVYPDLSRVLLYSFLGSELPRGLLLEISGDGKEWKTLHRIPDYWGPLFWSGPHPFHRPGNGPLELVFPPQSGRFLRLTQIGQDTASTWAVNELAIYQAIPRTGPEMITSRDVKGLLAHLPKTILKDLYTDPWLRAHFPADWQRCFEDPSASVKLESTLNRENWIPPLSSPAFLIRKEAGLNRSNLDPFSPGPLVREDRPPYVLFRFPSEETRFRPLTRRGWQVTTNANPSKASRAIDGNLATRWDSGSPQSPGIFLLLDLGKVEKVSRIRLLVADSLNDHPRGCQISTSTDGQEWLAITPRKDPFPLYWTGEKVVRYHKGDMDILMPPTDMRYLKILQTGQDDTQYWSIHELEVYEAEGKKNLAIDNKME